MVRVAVFGATLTGNKGAEAMFTSITQNLPSYLKVSKFYLFSYYPHDDRTRPCPDNVEIVCGSPYMIIFLFPIITCFYRLFHIFLKKEILENRMLSALVMSDIFLDVGGVSFVDGREKYLPFNIGCLLPAFILGKPVIKLSQAMGPFHGLINRISARFFLSHVTGVVSRGKMTSQHLHELGIKNFIEASDLAFSSKKKLNPEIRNYFSSDFLSKDIVGISPSAEVWLRCQKNGVNYSEIMAEFINYIIKKTTSNVVIIPHSIRRYSSKLKNNDLPVCKEIMEMVDEKERCIFVSDELTYLEIRQIIGLTRFFLASRFHAMISALLEEKPTIVCGWSHKYSEVLDQFGIKELALDYNNISCNNLINAFERVRDEEGIIVGRITENLPDVMNSSQKNFAYIKNLLKI